MLLFCRIAATQEIIEYSMYDEFGSIMFSGPGQLVKNGRYAYQPPETEVEPEASPYRYRWSSEPVESEAEMTFRPGKRYGRQQQVWKFRPREEKKEKKIIKIEDPPVAPVFRQPQYQHYQYRAPMLSPPGIFIPYIP
jgi:hypothetical protein